MNPLLKFLAAARSLASQGLKKEEIYSFARQEFGEVNELMKRQIDNIFKPQKPIVSRNKPLDPDDVLPNYNETPGEFARRETPGSKENLLQELKIAYEKEFNRLRGDETAGELKEILKNLDTDGVPFATGGRAGYYGGGITNMVEPDLSDIGHGGESLNARTRVMSPGSQATTSTGLNYLLGEDNDNTRVPFNKGKLAKKAVDEGRRGFMKAAGAGAAGIAALKTGLLGFADKAVPVVEKVAEAAGQAPTHFFKLVEKIKNLGTDVTEVLAYKSRQKVTKYKDFELTEDLTTGRQEIQRMKVLDDADAADYYGQPLTEETYMSYKPGKGQIDEMTKGKTPPDEYEEGTALLRSDREYAGEVVEEMSGVSDDIFEEVGEKIPEAIRKGQADGGRIGFVKGKLVKEGVPALINKVKSLFGEKSITTADKIPTPQKTLDRDMFKAADNRLNDKKMMNADELEDFEMEIGDNIEAYSFDGTVGDAKRILQEEADYAAEMLAEYKSIGGSKRLGGPKDPMVDAIDNASPGYTGDLKYDAQLVADDLAEKMYGVEYDDLTQTQQMDLYDKAYTALSKNQQGFKQMKNLSKPEKTLKGIKKTGVVDISDPDVAEEFTKFMKESDPKGFTDMEQKIQLESFDPKTKGRKGNAEGGRIGLFLGGGLKAGKALTKEMLKFMSKDSANAKSPAGILKMMNPKQFEKLLDNPSYTGKISPATGETADQMILDMIKKTKEDRSSMVGDLIGSARKIKKVDDDIAVYKQKIIKDMIAKGINENEARGFADLMAKEIKKTAAPQLTSSPPKVTEQGLLELENIQKNLLTRDRQLQASGGLATMLGE